MYEGLKEKLNVLTKVTYLSGSDYRIGWHTPLVSIAVVSYNSSKDLSVLLPSLKKQTYSNWELILVENGGQRSDIEAKFIKDFKFLKLDNPGTEANNKALEIADGSLILLQNRHLS